MRVRAGIAVGAVAAALALTAPADASADYGAIAVNPATGAAGVGFNFNKKGPALRRAQRECPGNCRISIWVRNQCGATVLNNDRFISRPGRTKRKAIRRAKDAAGGGRLVAWVCSG